jgi:ParB-like chromosome segregation protein Spo0J
MALQTTDGRKLDHIGQRKGYSVAYDHLEPNPDNPRLRDTDEWRAGVAELVESIRQSGYHDNSPLYCKELPDERWRVYDGNRRLEAIGILVREGIEFGKFPIERIRKDMDAADLLAISLRPGSLPLTAIEAAAQITKMRRLQLDERQIAEKTGRDIEWVRRHLRLNGAPTEIKEAVQTHIIAASEADRLIRHAPDPVAALSASVEAATLAGSVKDGHVRVRTRHVAVAVPKAREVKLAPAERAIVGFLAEWDMLRMAPVLPEKIMARIEAMREVVP